MNTTAEQVSEVMRRFYIVKAPKKLSLGDLERKIDKYVTESNTTDSMISEMRKREELPFFLAETGNYQLLEARYHDRYTGRMLGRYAREFHFLFEGKPKDFTVIEECFRKIGMDVYQARTCGRDVQFEQLSGERYHKKTVSDYIRACIASDAIAIALIVGGVCAAVAGSYYFGNALYRGSGSGDGFFQTVKTDIFGRNAREAGR